MNNKSWDSLWINAHLAVLQGSYNLIPNGALAVKNGQIAWVGPMDAARPEQALQVIDVQGRLLTPGLIDCHTHLVYAGNRAQEWAQRLKGLSYEAIARAGGGILATVKATRAASEDLLLQESLPRVDALMRSGVTTIEIKSGYGLDLATERKLLRVAKRIEEERSITVKKTFLGAHALPLEYQNRADDYIDLVCNEMLPQLMAENLVDAVDVFCEKIGFTLAQTERVFRAALDLNLPIKCHAEQLSAMGATELAASFKALSIDHGEYLTKVGVQALAESGAVLVLLPGAFYYLRETQLPPVALLREYRVPMAIATDCNPGTSPVTSLLVMLNMACVLFQLTPEEALLGVTNHAAKALGLSGTHGSLDVGKVADFLVWNVAHPDELPYAIGLPLLQQRIKAGQKTLIVD